MNNENPKKRMGRPPKKRNVVLYRSGNKIKAYNTDLNISAPATSKDIGSGLKIYAGLCFDWVNWGKVTPAAGWYNAATHVPLQYAPDPLDQGTMAKLERDYKDSPLLRRVMDACEELFRARRPKDQIILEGVWWMQVLSEIFIPEAGMDGVSRSRFERPFGKIWASVNVLPTRGPGYNYTEEAWYSVVTMKRAPVFCVKITGDGHISQGGNGLPDWQPEDLAKAILHGLWAAKGVNSCEALDTAPSSEPETAPQPAPVASGEATPPLQASDEAPTLESHPDAVGERRGDLVLEPEVLPTLRTFTEAECKMAEAEQQARRLQAGVLAGQCDPEVAQQEILRLAQVAAMQKAGDKPTIPEPTPTPDARTWGEIKTTPIWMKGLTSSNELQAPAPLSRILESVVSHEATKRLTDECRAIADKKERNEYKRDNLHVFYPSAVFAGRAGGGKKENLVGYTGLAALDFDGMKTFEEAEDTRDDIFMQFPEVLFAAVSASGLGVYALVTLDFDGTEAGYKAALSGAMENFEAKGYMPDTGCSDPTRARYMSSDADAVQRQDSYVPKAFSASEEGGFILPATMLRSCWTNSGRKKKGAGKVYLEEALSRIENAPDGMKDTVMTSVMGSVARLIRNYNMNAEQVYDKVRKVGMECGYDTKKTEDKIRRLGVKNQGGVL